MVAGLGEYIRGEDETTLEETVVKAMQKKGLKLATAESCTGGMLAARITDVSGASGVFTEGFIVYSNGAKINTLGIDKKIIEKYGAVSKECADEMAKKAAEKSGAVIAVSITGIAGPLGGSEAKPVGRVYIGLFYNGSTTVKENNFKGNRQSVRAEAVKTALEMIMASVGETLQ